MKELQFAELPSQASIYSVTRLGSLIIVGTGNYGKIFAYSHEGCLEELVLQDFPAGLEVLGIEAYEDFSPVLCIAAVHKNGSDSEDKSKAHIYFYSRANLSPDLASFGTSSESFTTPGSLHIRSCLDRESLTSLMSASPRVFPLDFVPYDLLHIPVQRDIEAYDHLLVVTGSDALVHAFRVDSNSTDVEIVGIETYFPELNTKFQSIVTRIQVETFNEATRRITLCGCEDGTLHIWIVTSNEKSGRSKSRDSQGCDEEEIVNVKKLEHYYDGMINCIQPFTEGFQLNIVVASACSPAYVYTNATQDHCDAGLPLKFSSRFDAVEAVCVADVDLDGKPEIIIGTFGCTLLVYKYVEDICSQWLIVAYQKFPSGILHIDFINYSLHVITASGIHKMEYSTSAYFHKQATMISGSIPEETLTVSESTLDEKASDHPQEADVT